MTMPFKRRQEKSIAIVNDLLMVSNFLQRTANRHASQYGLKRLHLSVLTEIIEKQSCSQRDITGQLLIEKSNLSKIIKKLREMGLIEVTSVGEDRRKTLLKVTEKGNDLWQQCMGDLDILKQEFIRSIDDESLDTICDSLARLKERVQFLVDRQP